MNHGQRVYRSVGAFAVLLLLTVPSEIASQVGSAPDVAEFSFVVSTTDTGIDLTCTKGCAWTALSFSARVGDTPQAVDQYGMASGREERGSDRAGLADFLFTARRVADGVKLVGERGTAWTTLGFSCEGRCDQAIDQHGMVERPG